MTAQVAIVDFGLGNLFSVQLACAAVGLEAAITSDPDDLRSAGAIILPGVGAFGDAMQALRARGLDAALRKVSADGKLVIGICLGMQLLFSSSEEFGENEGLRILTGTVRRLAPGTIGSRAIAKVPEVGWNSVKLVRDWHGTPLEGVSDGDHFYFVHSYYCVPAAPEQTLSTTTYGGIEYCSSVSVGNTHGFQFHPERSGPAGIAIYQNIRRWLDAPARRMRG